MLNLVLDCVQQHCLLLVMTANCALERMNCLRSSCRVKTETLSGLPTTQASTLTIHASENCLLVPGFVSHLHSDVERLLQRSNMHVPCSNTYQFGTRLSARRCLTGPLLSLDTASDRSCRIKTERENILNICNN